jgi:dTMP kinase
MVFLVFEGGEGVGKTTQIKLLFEKLTKQGIPCTLTREPGGTPFAEELRSLFKKNPVHNDLPLPLTELFLISAARAQHVHTYIQPLLKRGRWVICDRFLDSTYVYQCLVGGLEKSFVDLVSQPILQGLMPHVTFVLDAPPQKTQQRLDQRTHRGGDRLDAQQLSWHVQVQKAYQKLVQENVLYPCGQVPRRVLIPAQQNVEEVALEIQNVLSRNWGIKI